MITVARLPHHARCFSGREHTFICASAGGVAVEIEQPGNEMASSGGGMGPLVQHLVFAGA